MLKILLSCMDIQKASTTYCFIGLFVSVPLQLCMFSIWSCEFSSFLFFKIALVGLGSLHFHMFFRIGLSISTVEQQQQNLLGF